MDDIKELGVRIDNLKLTSASYLCEPPEHPAFAIDKIVPNPYYQKESEYLWSPDGAYAYTEEYPDFHISKTCFVHPETRYTLASFEYQEKECFYELHFTGARPLDLDDEERDVFWRLVTIGHLILNRASVKIS